MKETRRRLVIALLCYAVLIGVALFYLLPARNRDEQAILGAVLAVFALLILKTLAHAGREE